MIREDLEKIEGLTKEMINSVLELYKEDVKNHKKIVDGLKTDIKTEQGKIAGLTKDLEEFKGLDIEGLKNQQVTFEQEKQKLIEGHNQAINDLKFNSALDLAIVKAQSIDPIGLGAHLDKSKLAYNDETKQLDGFEEQLKDIKANQPYLFNGQPSGQDHGDLGGKGPEVMTLSGALASHYENK